MRALSLACLVALALAPAARAQQAPPATLKIERVKVGFRTGGPDDSAGSFKTGLWVPVHVTLAPAPDGPVVLPVRVDGTVEGQVRVETPDSDGVPTVYAEPFKFQIPAGARAKRIHLIAYAKVAASEPEVRVSVRPGGQGARTADIPFTGPVERGEGRNVNDSIYLTLGARLPQLHTGLVLLTKAPKEESDKTRPRYLGHEADVERLPTRWFGYDAVDLAILCTDNNTFLKDLLKTSNQPRLEALAEWVRRGGRLVISVSWPNQELVHRLLNNARKGPPVWTPPLPDLLALPAGKEQPSVTRMAEVQSWARGEGQVKPFFEPDQDPLRIAKLKANPSAEIFLEEEGYPLMLRTPYGRGSVTLLAFDVAKAPFTAWEGGPGFWRTLVIRLAPKSLNPDQAQQQRAVRMGPRGVEMEVGDLTTRLQQELDKFDTPPISFGWVALFILLYILVVGPLDYLLLKKVFKRLELTWITFPAIVLAISLIAYFTAYAVKGKELKVNKLDLVDVDLRSDLGEDLRPRKATAYGSTWFTILSPRIQNYTVGIEPVFPRLVDGEGTKSPEATVAWLGRPEAGGMGASGRQQSQSFFTRTYQFAPGAAGLTGVPIPVWTTKSFTASWAAPLNKLPFDARLEYDPDQQVSGTFRNHLPLDLHDVKLVYRDKWYRLPDCRSGGQAVQVSLKAGEGRDMTSWSQQRGMAVQFDPEDMRPAGPYDPGQVLTELLFHEKGGTFGAFGNHAQRRLDESWRLPEEWRGRPPTVRDAILVARLQNARGSAETLEGENDPRLPTHLWLDALPGGEQRRPSISGTLAQDTYIRVFLPVTPRKQQGANP
jgi:hypothetical protein